MDVAAIHRELLALQAQKNEVKQRLDTFRGRGPRFEQRLHDNSRGPPHGPEAMDARAPARGRGPRGSGSVFARLAGGALGGSGRDARNNANGSSRVRSNTEHDDRFDVDRVDTEQAGPERPSVRSRMAYTEHDVRGQRVHDSRDRASGPGRRGRDRFDGGEPDAGLQVSPTAARRRLLSSAVVADTTDQQPYENNNHDNNSEDMERQPSRSLVDYGDDEVEHGQQHGHETGTKKRPLESQPALQEPDNMRKRNRRMFGALMGTLQRFRKEDAQFQESDVAAKRQEMLRKAEERDRQQSEVLRRREAEIRAQQRDEELARLSEISLAADTKALELIYANKIARREALSKFCVTTTQPHIHWCPSHPNQVTDALLEAQRQELQEWKAAQVSELEVEKQSLVQRSLERRETALARKAAREERLAAARAAGGTAAGDALLDQHKKEEEEDQRELEAGEYAVVDEETHNSTLDKSHTANQMDTDEPAARPKTAEAQSEGQEDGEYEEKPEDQAQDHGGDAVMDQDQAEQAQQEDEDEQMQGDADKDKEAETVEDLLS